ncbi:hypothetical protein [Acinetobacter baumannii]|uniref:hypothetical protein n=1 Tax=Acinetobacter baumannii TaxID=470 RepID=UPI003CC7A0D7
MRKNEILLWTFNPDIRPIINALTELYSSLKPLKVFNNMADCIYYYLNQISPIFRKQAQHDSMMSKEFNFFFQTKDEYFFGEFLNNSSNTLNRK